SCQFRIRQDNSTPAVKVAGLDGRLELTRFSVDSQVSDALPIRGPTLGKNPFVIAEGEDLARLFAAGTHHPQLARPRVLQKGHQGTIVGDLRENTFRVNRAWRTAHN